MKNTTTTATPATTHEGIAISVTAQREAETSVIKQEGTISSSMHERSSSLLGRTQQGQSALIATQVSPTIHHNYTHSLVAVVGHSISLPCSSTVKRNFIWSHRPLGSNILSTIYNGHRIISNDQLASKMTVSNCDYVRECTLQVHEMRIDAAGTFSCRKSDGYDYWSLTILRK